MSRGRRVEFCPGYLLHQRPFRDTSLVLELYTAEHGRLGAFARAARGGTRRFGALQPFQPLLFSWSGRGEAPTLTAAECDGPAVRLPPEALMGGFYLNELVLRLTVAHDANPPLYASYAAALARLHAGAALEPVLRGFELELLGHLGYGLELGHAAGGEAVREDGYYRLQPGVGLRAVGPEADGAVPGGLLLALAGGMQPHDAEGRRRLRLLLRAALDHCLEGRELGSRAVARELHRLGQRGA